MFTNLKRIYRTITLSNILDLKPSLYRPIPYGPPYKSDTYKFALYF